MNPIITNIYPYIFLILKLKIYHFFKMKKILRYNITFHLGVYHA